MANNSVAVIGAGVSGIGAAKTLKALGFDVTIYERSSSLGGIWNIGYQDLQIQSFDFQYHFSDLPWPKSIPCDSHPTSRQIVKYLEFAVAHYDLKVKYNYEIISMEERNQGWVLCISTSIGKLLKNFDYVIVSTGLFTDGKFRPLFPGQEVIFEST